MTWYEGDDNGPGQLVVSPTDPGQRPAGGLSQTVLRGINFNDAVKTIRKADEFAGKLPKINWDTIGSELADMSANGITDEYLAWLSLVYSASARSTPKPVQYLGELTGKSPATIKSHLFQATRKNFLERSPGRPGGRVTLEAVGFLKAET